MDETMEETTQPPRSCINQLNHLQEETSIEIYILRLSRLRPKLKGPRIKSVDQAKQLKREFYKNSPDLRDTYRDTAAMLAILKADPEVVLDILTLAKC